MLTRLYVKGSFFVRKYFKNEKGAISLEWLALMMVVMAIMAAILAAVNSESGNLGKTVVDKIKEFLAKIQS